MALISTPPVARAAPGSSVVVRLATESDAVGLVELTNRLAEEATLLFVVPVDSETGLEDLRHFLRTRETSCNHAVVVAESGGALVGLATATGGVHPAKRATIEIGIGVLAAHVGRGIGTALMAGLEQWARAAGIRRLQLPVVTSNAPAIALYEKCGFTVEGVLRDSAHVDGRYVDQYMMAKLLEARSGAEPGAG